MSGKNYATDTKFLPQAMAKNVNWRAGNDL